jgi:hypothetical protein
MNDVDNNATVLYQMITSVLLIEYTVLIIVLTHWHHLNICLIHKHIWCCKTIREEEQKISSSFLMKFRHLISTNSMMTILPIFLFILISSFDSKNVFLKRTNKNLPSNFFQLLMVHHPVTYVIRAEQHGIRQ